MPLWRNTIPVLSMGKSPKRKPGIKETPEAGRKPTIIQKPSSDFFPSVTEKPDKSFDAKVAWRFHKMDCSGFGKCTLKLLDPYLADLIKHEGRTVGEIKRLKHNHDWNPARLDDKVRERIKQLCIDEETLSQITLGQRPRLYGIWEGNVFHILWLDKLHEIYRCQ